MVARALGVTLDELTEMDEPEPAPEPKRKRKR
jgi:hypothetical protein